MAEQISKQTKPDAFYIQGLLLAEVVKRILNKKAEIRLSAKPVLQLKPIVEFMKRMRSTSIGKFQGRTYIATINFYSNAENMENHKALGALVLYIGEEYVVKILQTLEYPIFDEDDQDGLEDACGSFCNLIGGNFKSALRQLGYKEILMSHFSTYQNDVFSGVEYPFGETHLYEITFEIAGQKQIVGELTLGRVPHVEDDLKFSYFK